MKRTRYIAMLTALALTSPAVAHAVPAEDPAADARGLVDSLNNAEAVSDADPNALLDQLAPPQPVAGAMAAEGAAGDSRCVDKLVLDRGHIDIKAVREGDKFVTRVKDETGIYDSKTVDRKLDDVLIAVHDNALAERPDALKAQEFDYLGPVGERFFRLPQTQNRDIIWPGYNTQELNYGDYEGGVNLNLEPVSVPEGASWGMFLETGFGDFQQLLNSLTKDNTVETDFDAHTHTNWGFTKPGLYTFKVTYTAKAKNGKRIASDPQNLTFAVGNTAVESCAKPDPEPKPKPKPEPQPEPKPDPKPDGSSASPWAWLGPVLGLGVIGALVAAVLPMLQGGDLIAQLKNRLGLQI